ncbi:unnamed protein product, partial [Musa hybrid cultivar]
LFIATLTYSAFFFAISTLRSFVSLLDMPQSFSLPTITVLSY